MEDSILAIRPLSGLRQLKVSLPGSKSITNRALLLATLQHNSTKLHGALFSDDTRVMLQCLKSLGFQTSSDEAKKTISLQGLHGEIPNAHAELFVGNAGTAARFLPPLLALKKDGNYSLDGTPAMRKRPMRGLLEALQQLGCQFTWKGEEWHFPFSMKTHGIDADSVSVNASASSQILSAFLLIAPAAAKPSKTFSVCLSGETVSRPFVDMTLQMIRSFGGAVEAHGPEFICGGGYLTKPEPFAYEIEPDATAASYFAVLPFVHPQCMVDIPGLVLQDSLQGDSEFVAKLSTPPHNLLSIEEIDGGIRVSKGPYPSPVWGEGRGEASTGFEMDFNDISDTFLTLAAIAPLLESPLTITGIEHTRKQETDRVAAATSELAKIVGEQNVSQTDDSLSIRPCPLSEIRARADASPDGIIPIETYDDHRIAMSFAILGTYDLRGDSSPWLAIQNPNCCQKTFPNFFSELLQNA